MHRFTVGQQLDMLPMHGSSSRRAGLCTIVTLMPYEGYAVQYRVQSNSETFQRIVSENDLREPGNA
jgi:hypothetical protein